MSIKLTATISSTLVNSVIALASSKRAVRTAVGKSLIGAASMGADDDCGFIVAGMSSNVTRGETFQTFSAAVLI